MESEGGDLMNLLIPGQGSEDDHRRVVDGATHISPTDYGQGTLEFSARMQTLSQNAGLQQSIPPIMSPSHGSQNYGMFQSQQSFPQNTGGSILQQSDLYQMPGQQSSSYFGSGNFSGYGSGYPNQTSKQRDLANSSGYQTNYQQADAYGSAGSLQNFGQFDAAPPLSPTQHQPSVLSSNTMHPGMMHSGNSFSYGSIPRASTGSAIPQQMQMQASGFQGNLQQPVSSASYSQMQMSNQGSISVGSTGYSGYAGPARTRSSPVSQQSMAMSNVPGSFSGLSPPSPKQMHLPCRTLDSPVLQQMQSTRSQSSHLLQSPGSASHSKQTASSPFTHDSSPPPLAGIVQRSPTPVQQIYGSNTATQQLSPHHSQFSLQTAPPQLPCMFGWGNDALASRSLTSPTQLRHLQQLVSDEESGSTLQARASNSRSVIQPTGINKMPSPVSRKSGGGSVLSRKHSAGSAATAKPGPSPKIPKLDRCSPPKNKRRSPCNVLVNKLDVTVTGEQTEKLNSETVQVKTGTRNGVSPCELGVTQSEETLISEEDQGQTLRLTENKKIESDIEAQQEVSDNDTPSVTRSDVYGSLSVEGELHEKDESVNKIKLAVDSMKTEDKINTVGNTGGKTETNLEDRSNSESLMGDNKSQALDEDEPFLKTEKQLTHKCEQKMADQKLDREGFKTKQFVEVEAEKNEQIELFNHDKSPEPSEKTPDIKTVDQSGLLKESSPQPNVTDSLNENKGRSTALVIEESSNSVLNTSGDEMEKPSAADEKQKSINFKTTSDLSEVHKKGEKVEDEEMIKSDLGLDTKEITKRSTIKPADPDQEMALMNKTSKSTGVQSVVVTSVAGGASALSGTTAITASVIAKGQAQGSGQQVLVAKTPSGQMYLIQGNVLIPVQNVQVQQEKGKNGSKVIVVNPTQGTSGKHSTVKTTSTITKQTSSTDSQKTIKSKPNVLSRSTDKKQQIGSLQTQEQEVVSARRDSKPQTVSISSKERLKEKIVGNLDAKIKVIERTERHLESIVSTSPSSKGSPNLSAKGKKIGRPLGSKDKQKRKPYASRRSNSLSTVESVVDEPSTQVETHKKGQRGRPRKSESEKLTPQKVFKRTVASDVPIVGYTPEGTKKTKYSTRTPSIKFISVIPKGCGVGDTWCCCLCGKPPHFGYLGVLFGPYKAKLLSREMIESSARKSPSSKLLSPISKNKQSAAENNETAVGTDSETQVLELWVHKECAVWSHGVYMQGRNLEGLEQVAESATQHKCEKCSQVGATLACFKRGCTQIYHFACAKESGCSFREDNYTIFCAEHVNK